MGYDLTNSQKSLAKWLVQQVHDNKLSEEFVVIWVGPEVGSESGLVEGRIVQFQGEHPIVTKGALNALTRAGLLICAPNFQTTTQQFTSSVYYGPGPTTTHREEEINRTCTLTARAYEAVDSDFELPFDQVGTQVTIGAIIHTMSGGNVQAVGVAWDAEVSQIVNDPVLLRSQVEALTENLLNEVKPALRVDELIEYAQVVEDLKEQILAKRPDPSLIQRLVRTVGLLGDIEGTIGLMTRVWSFLHPLLLIAAARLS